PAYHRNSHNFACNVFISKIADRWQPVHRKLYTLWCRVALFCINRFPLQLSWRVDFVDRVPHKGWLGGQPRTRGSTLQAPFFEVNDGSAINLAQLTHMRQSREDKESLQTQNLTKCSTGSACMARDS